MRAQFAFLLGLPLLASALTATENAAACGGCFVGETENTQVTGHRMIMSVSKTQTTLYDQIQYSGDPEDFAWVLPIRGQVDVGLSSDALFSLLEQETAAVIQSPQIACAPSSNSCDDGSFGNGGSSAEGGSGPGVEVIAQEVVGPYETVQLSASDPEALNLWLEEHGYNIPPAVQPVIEAYVADGMDFLALRLSPGKGVSSMRPVRVTTPGGGPVLPLRMVAAGTGAKTAITLWVVSEGRYEPQNFPSFQIDSESLVWDWDASRSNYSELRAAGFAAGDGLGWLVEAGEPYYNDFGQLTSLASYDATGSGYADADGQNAEANAQADIDVLTGGIDGMWISRLSAELPFAGLSSDLVLQASSEQVAVPRFFDVTNTIGTEPQCPPVAPDPCADGDQGVLGFIFDFNGNGDGSKLGGGCAASPGFSSRLPLAWFAIGLGAAIWRRRRAR